MGSLGLLSSGVDVMVRERSQQVALCPVAGAALARAAARLAAQGDGAPDVVASATKALGRAPNGDGGVDGDDEVDGLDSLVSLRLWAANGKGRARNCS